MKMLRWFLLFLLPSVLSGAQDAEGPLPGTSPLELHRDLALAMVGGIDEYLTRELASSPGKRREHWKPDFSSPDAYAQSVETNRARLRRIVGAGDPRPVVPRLEYVATPAAPSLVGRGPGYEVHAVRWSVLPGVEAEGLLINPDGKPVARVIALPDADETPEQVAGLAPGLPSDSQTARRLAEGGCQVLVPVLIDRSDRWSGNPEVALTNQSHREFIHRPAFEMGRHVIGYEIQKVLAAVDWFFRDAGGERPRIGAVGYGEGGLLALYAAALDTRIDAAVIRGYFQERETVWKEPLYRNVWSLLREFGDAELAALVAPRNLIIDSAPGPRVEGPSASPGRLRVAAPGALEPPPEASIRREFSRARTPYLNLGIPERLRLVGPSGNGGDGLSALAELPGFRPSRNGTAPPENLRTDHDAAGRLKRQVDQLTEYTQRLVRESPSVREKFWAKADVTSLDRFVETSKPYRDYLWEEVIGRLPPPSLPPNPRARQIYDRPGWNGYRVVLDLYPDVFASGILLVPKGLKAGERRPVVVCQHGLEGRPEDTITPDGEGFRYYRSFAARLADLGYVVFSPQNPYTGHDRFRILQRKANPLKLTIYSFIVRQHERALDWLSTLPFVDAGRIGFYGLSYGGKTAVRIPTILADRYALSICSGDFNEMVWKTTSLKFPGSFLYTADWEIFEFDLGNTFNYSDLASLMLPRPFMVERGMRDSVAPEEWVSYEQAKLRRLYTRLGVRDRTAFESFDGGHEIRAEGTFAFLGRYLRGEKE